MRHILIFTLLLLSGCSSPAHNCRVQAFKDYHSEDTISPDMVGIALGPIGGIISSMQPSDAKKASLDKAIDKCAAIAN